MSVIQVAFDVPDYIRIGVEVGELIIHGGVVRNTKGEIVHHLKNAGDVIKKADGKTKVIVAGATIIGTAVVIGGTFIINKIRNRNKISELEEFQLEFTKYIKAALNGEICKDQIISLNKASINLLNALDQYENSDFSINNKELKKIVEVINSIKKYTQDLYLVNKNEEILLEETKCNSIKDNLIDLSKYLNFQEVLYEENIG